MTLIEIMVVIAIMGLVMGAIVVGVFPAFKRAQCKTAWSTAAQVAEQIVAYQTDNSGDCPSSIDDLVQGKYLQKQPLDPWGQVIQFTCPGEENTDGADVWSDGPNKTSGDADDVKAWLRQADACNPKKK